MNNRRDFLKFSAAVVPVVALGLPLLEQPNWKVFCLDHGGDVSYIIAENAERVKHWWFTELSGESVPDDAEVEEISPDTLLRVGIEDLDDISKEDQEHHLYYRIVNKDENYRLHQWNSWEPHKWTNSRLWNQSSQITPTRLAHEFKGSSDNKWLLQFCIKKPAELFLKETLVNSYPIPCCFCTTAG